MPTSPGQKLDLNTCTRQELLNKIERQKTQMQRNEAAYARELKSYSRRYLALEQIKKDLNKLLRHTDRVLTAEMIFDLNSD